MNLVAVRCEVAASRRLKCVQAKINPALMTECPIEGGGLLSFILRTLEENILIGCSDFRKRVIRKKAKLFAVRDAWSD